MSGLLPHQDNSAVFHEDIAKAYRPGKFMEDAVSTFIDHFSGNGFLHDVECENRQSSKERRYPIVNVY